MSSPSSNPRRLRPQILRAWPRRRPRQRAQPQRTSPLRMLLHRSTPPRRPRPVARGLRREAGRAVPGAVRPEGPPKPIKLRIHVDLQARAPGVFSRRALGPFFARYTTNNAYLKVLSTATQRFDLDGQPAGEVTEEHRAAALAELARRREIAIAKRGAERAAERAASRPAPPSDRPPRERRPGTQASTGKRKSVDRARRARPDRRPDRRGPGDRTTAHRSPAAGRAGPPPGHAAARPPSNRPASRPAEAPAPEPQDPAQRERALLLRQFESQPADQGQLLCAPAHRRGRSRRATRAGARRARRARPALSGTRSVQRSPRHSKITASPA
jgi:sRNA-binding protein